MPMMELGVLSDMFDIKKKALKKLFKQQVKVFISILLVIFYSLSFLPVSLFLITYFLCSEFISNQSFIVVQGIGKCGT